MAVGMLGLDTDSGRPVEVVVFAVMLMFDGETISMVIDARAEVEEERLRWLVAATSAALRASW